MDSSIFYLAVDAIIHGQTDQLKDLLRQYPTITQMRSSKKHGASLIHYVSANGVEDHLQRCAPNAVEIATMLLDAGADPNASASFYGDDDRPLEMLVSSVHPYLAGVQEDLAKLLIQYGAQAEGHMGDGAPLGLALGFGYRSTAEQLLAIGCKHDNILYAAGLGLTDLILDNEENPEFYKFKMANDDKVGAFSWPPPKSHSPLYSPFIYACFHDRTPVVNLFLKKGMDPNASVSYNQVGLHFAAYQGHIKTVDLLISAGADPQKKDLQFSKSPAEWARMNDYFELADRIEEKD